MGIPEGTRGLGLLGAELIACDSRTHSTTYIHGRNIGHSVKKWPDLLAEVMGHLNGSTGCRFELAEIGSRVFSDYGSVLADWPPNRLFDLFNEGVESLVQKSSDDEILEKLLLRCWIRGC